MKRIALFVAALAIAFGARASFSAVAPSGQTLYFDYVSQSSHTVEVAMHTYYEWNGALVIPDSVENDGVWYTVVGIGPQAFLSLQNHCGPTAITIPNTVRFIGLLRRKTAFCAERIFSAKCLPSWIRIVR